MLTKSGIPFKCRVCKQRPCVGVNCPSTRHISTSSSSNRKPAKLVRDRFSYWRFVATKKAVLA